MAAALLALLALSAATGANAAGRGHSRGHSRSSRRPPPPKPTRPPLTARPPLDPFFTAPPPGPGRGRGRPKPPSPPSPPGVRPPPWGGFASYEQEVCEFEQNATSKETKTGHEKWAITSALLAVHTCADAPARSLAAIAELFLPSSVSKARVQLICRYNGSS